MPAPLRPDDPSRLGAYLLDARLGQGGFGTVYLARREGEDHQVALKVLHEQWAHDPDVRRRFAAEVEAARRVPTQCTVALLDADTEAARPYMVSEFVPGPSLGQAVRDGGPFNEDGLRSLALATATALATIHGAGLVHRDFKPENVLLGPDGPRVIDFGISRALEGASATASAMIGTPAYMAPEQFDQQRVSPAVDVFAWGAVMVFAATGRPAFSGSAPVVMRRILEGRPELHGYTGPLRPLLDAALHSDARARPTAVQLLEQLLDPHSRFGDQPLRPPSGTPTPGPPPPQAGTPVPPGGGTTPPRGAATPPGGAPGWTPGVVPHHAGPPAGGHGAGHGPAGPPSRPPGAPPGVPGGAPGPGTPPPRRSGRGLPTGAIVGGAAAFLALAVGGAATAAAVLLTERNGVGSGTDGDPQRNESEAFVYAVDYLPDAPVPIMARDTGHHRIFAQVVEPLLTHEPGGTDIEAGLAEDWGHSDDGTEWTFRLRDGVVFHDGEPLDAEAVCATFDHYNNLTGADAVSTGAASWHTIFGGFAEDGTSNYESCAATDDLTAVITLGEYTPAFPGAFTLPAFGVLSPDTVTALAELSHLDQFTDAQALSGTGPYRFTRWDPNGDGIVLERHHEYWNAPARIATVNIVPIEDAQARQAALEAGEIHATDFTHPSDLDALTNEGFQIATPEPATVLFLGFQQDNEALAAPEVRQAIARAIDREPLLDTLPHGSVEATQFVPSAVDGWSSDAPEYPHDPATAAELLADSEHDGAELELCFGDDAVRYYLPHASDTAEMIAAFLEEVGLSPVLQALPTVEFVPQALDGECDMYLLANSSGYNSADSYLGWGFSTEHAAWGFSDDDVFAAVTAAGAEPDSEERTELYEAANEVVMDFLPGLPLAEVPYVTVYAEYVEPPAPSPFRHERLAEASFV